MKQKIQKRNDDVTFFQIFHMFRGSSEGYMLNRVIKNSQHENRNNLKQKKMFLKEHIKFFFF
jgi:hypothetical protein